MQRLGRSQCPAAKERSTCDAPGPGPLPVRSGCAWRVGQGGARLRGFGHGGHGPRGATAAGCTLRHSMHHCCATCVNSEPPSTMCHFCRSSHKCNGLVLTQTEAGLGRSSPHTSPNAGKHSSRRAAALAVKISWTIGATRRENASGVCRPLAKQGVDGVGGGWSGSGNGKKGGWIWVAGSAGGKAEWLHARPSSRMRARTKACCAHRCKWRPKSA